MKPLLSILERTLQHNRKWDFIIFTLLTLLSVVNGQSTVFYIIYFFWFSELIRIIVDRFCYKQNENSIVNIKKGKTIFSSLFIMVVYFIFIIVFFGFIANWKNNELTLINMEVLFFKNWFFNSNLLFVLVERIYLHKTEQPLAVGFGMFTPNILILHISIIMGAALLFFVVKNFPKTFTPDNLWGSVIIIFPFLILSAILSFYNTSKINIQQ
ncbi:hypothetical protein V1T75_15100 [Tenacibaculum sp. FZY0031]|uniref:hypothetical protein n=1 Tax=Tenacibaculum sp. FZY0031 TaxID=3116648 RepID=UPI002EBDF733|nr:hypothetical protein [Tenacibaculum sp. FZY0031]